MKKENRFDLYFSYWIMFWALYSIIFKTTIYPLIFLSFTFIIQYIYIYNNICEIINTKYNYVLLGNLTVINIKYLLIIYGLLFRFDNYNIYTELLIGTILFIIFNLYYYAIVKKIYYLFTPDNKDSIPDVDIGPCVYLFKILLNGK
jgi:hypothetical protein